MSLKCKQLPQKQELGVNFHLSLATLQNSFKLEYFST